VIRLCAPNETAAILSIVNAGAEAYRGVIPDDCFHDPYMTPRQLQGDIAAGVSFWGYESDGELIGVMGLQHVADVDLIRHAYVSPSSQGRGVGSALLTHLQDSATCPMLVGTWAHAVWAIRFYERHGFALVPRDETPALLRKYWSISHRQIETSVVLTSRRA
jgi:N-acetylglutamate synthase-like GNAT family acetyltransferase